MADAAISFLAGKLRDKLIQKVNPLRGVMDQVQLLENELKMMQSFLVHADEKQVNDERIRNWISKIREVVLDAEDIIEIFENENQNRIRSQDGIGEDIKSILDRFKAIREIGVRYGLKDAEELQWRSEFEDTPRLAPCEYVVGLEDDVKKLLEPIMDEENKGLSVSAIVGMGGIGKSTLARAVYNHPDVVSGRFDCRAWVIVSRVLTRQKIITQLILETTISKHEKEQLLGKIQQLEEESPSDMYLQKKLEELLHSQLQGKTYFIVLDDVWEMEHYEFLMSAFRKQQDKTSRLLLTTRYNVIASHCQNLHVMKLLDPEKSWELFMKKSLVVNSNDEFPKSLEQIGRHIVKKCEGLPLSVAVMGGLLAKTRSSREWENALNGLESHVGIAATTISEILELSYQNLSPQLKSCYLCLAFFNQEDVTIPVKRLLNIMVGQGLIQQMGRTTIEEIARGYLDELIHRNMVQAKDLTLDNRVKNCHLHYSFRNICLKKAKEEMYLEILKGDRKISLYKPRHRVGQCNNLGSLSMEQNQCIRSLFLINVGEDFMEIDSSYYKSFQHLKILDLELAHNYELQKLPDSLQLLFGLKQLRVGKKSVKVLPQHSEFSLRPVKLSIWLNALKKLELLDFRTQLVEFGIGNG